MIQQFYGGSYALAKEEEIQKLLDQLDKDGSGTVDKQEFVKGLADFVESSMAAERLASPKGKRKMSSEDERQVIHSKLGMFFLQFTSDKQNVEKARERFAVQTDRVRQYTNTCALRVGPIGVCACVSMSVSGSGLVFDCVLLCV